MSEERLTFLAEFLRTVATNPTKGAMMKLAYKEGRNIDSAIPQGLAQEAKDIGINFDTHSYVMDYQDRLNKEVTVENIYEKAVRRFIDMK